MKSIIIILSLALTMGISSNFPSNDKWKDLLDPDLSEWDVYLGFPNKSTPIEGLPKNEQGEYSRPMGLNNDPKHVFSVFKENKELILKVSGEIYGCVATKQEYENYHLKLQVKWGEKKWEPRLDKERDTGILYHSLGDFGVDYWRTWMLSQELQIMEGSFGDYWSIAGSEIDIRAAKPAGEDVYVFNNNADPVSFGKINNCRREKNCEFNNGEWNTVELICYEGKSLHIVNGNVVMALSNSRYKSGMDEKPLTRGKIQIQSEAAEVYYKNIMIMAINNIPDQYAVYFK